MSRDASITFDWADGTHAFRLPIGQLRELQEKAGVGPQALFARLTDGSWRIDDIRETIRLGLIGGGMEPAAALTLVRRYVDERPFAEGLTPARLVIAAALFGSDEKTGKGKAARPRRGSRKPGASPSPPSTEPEPS